jgi:Domain of unknown function (DUF5666)
VNEMRTHLPRRVWIVAAGAVILVLALAAAATLVDRVAFHRDGRLVGRVGVASPVQWGMRPGPMGLPGRMRRGAPGGGGTITQISGSTLTLRTEAGTETVTTSGSTQYTRERRGISLSDLRVGDVVRVVPVAGGARPATPGTGTVEAGRVVVVEPVLAGRVQSIDGSTVTLVGRHGELLTVTLTDATTYFTGAQAATRSALTSDSRIVAAGSQDSLTHLVADMVTVLPARRAGGSRTWQVPGRPGGGAAPGRGAGGPGGAGA